MAVIYKKSTLKREIVLTEYKIGVLLEVFDTKGKLINESFTKFKKTKNV